MKNRLMTLLALTAVLVACKPKEDVKNDKMPIDKNATKETVDLYNKLFRTLDKGIMVGHQDDLAYGHAWYREPGRSDIKDVAGDYPAVIGWELGHVEIGEPYNLDSVFFSDMKRYIRETHDRGGITTLSWHGDNIVTGGTAWDCAQDSVVRTILPDGSNHEKYLTWLDRVADFFLDLKDKDGKYIPVVFRMYHEHTGDWFWWCSKQCTPEEYKKLWIMTVEYLRDKKNVHNLLYAYSPATVASETEFSERYPGDEYVDIVGYDCYAHGTKPEEVEKYKDNMDRNLQIVTAFASKTGKLPTIGETGMESIPDATYFTQTVYPVISKYRISWVLFWRNAWDEAKRDKHYYAPFEGHPAAKDFKKFVSKSGILMNEDIKQ